MAELFGSPDDKVVRPAGAARPTASQPAPQLFGDPGDRLVRSSSDRGVRGSDPGAWSAAGTGLEHGLMDPIYGGAQIGARMGPEEGGAAFADPADLAARQQTVDKVVKEREQAYRADPAVKAHPWAAGTGRMGGNIVTTAPLAAVPGGGEAALPARMLPAALGGAAIGATQPVTSGDFATEKAKQVGLGTALGALGLPVVEAGGRVLGAGLHAVGDLFRTTEPIIARYTRAVKPPVTAAQTAGQRASYQADAQSAISSIVDNKANLKFTDATGDVAAEGQLPQSLEQFGDAIAQTKQRIFNEYDSMAQRTEGHGVTVDLAPVNRELSNFAANPVIRTLDKSVADYALSRVETLQAQGRFTPGQAQEAIAHLNVSLKAFYANPSYDSASRAAVDALIANNLRKELDTAITEATGPGYQALKNAYGALTAIEKDVNKRAAVVARQEKGGGLFGRLADITSAAELMRAFTHLDPTAFASAAGINVIKRTYQRMRDPDRVVTQMFRDVERARNPQDPRFTLGNLFVAPSVAMTQGLTGSQDQRGDISAYLTDPAYQMIISGGALQ